MLGRAVAVEATSTYGLGEAEFIVFFDKRRTACGVFARDVFVGITPLSGAIVFLLAGFSTNPLCF